MEKEIKDKILRKEINKEEFLNYLKNVKDYKDYLFISNILEDFKDFIKDFKKCKIGIFRSFTLEPMVPFLKVSFLKRKIEAEILLGGFNSINQDLIEPKEWIKDLDFLFVFYRLEDFSLDFPYKINNMSIEEKENEINRIKEILNNWMDLSIKIVKCPIFFSNFDFPDYVSSEFYDSQDTKGLSYLINRLNSEILEAAKSRKIYILDLFKQQLKCGLKDYYDKRMYYISKYPFSQKATLLISNYISRFLKTFLLPQKKVLVLDLDNTLWGGIIGEDGIKGIKLGPEYPGIAYMDFQKKLLNLYQNGILLAISSKNNYEDVMEVFKNHPYMVLKEENFVAMKINWDEKENHIKEISRILNLGTDSFVFIDDSEYECERIKKTIPEVTVYNMPKDPLEISSFFEEIEDFDFVNLSEEDRKRGKMYREEAKREELRISSATIEDFYYSLKMKLQIGKVTPDNFQRISQLTQRTNQFNLTTKRYTEEDIKNFYENENYRLYWARLLDNFGDYGIIATAIILKEDDSFIVDTFLLSCRAIQRTVETAFLAYILKKAKEEGIKKIKGKIIYTKKNIPARDFYKRHNFIKVGQKENEEEWFAEIKNINLDYPEWFQIEEVN